MLCWAPCGSVVKCSNHGKHGCARSEGTNTQSQTDSNRVYYSTVQYCREECDMRLQHWCITSGKSWQISLVELNVLEPVGWQKLRAAPGIRTHDSEDSVRAHSPNAYYNVMINILRMLLFFYPHPPHPTQKKENLSLFFIPMLSFFFPLHIKLKVSTSF